MLKCAIVLLQLGPCFLKYCPVLWYFCICYGLTHILVRLKFLSLVAKAITRALRAGIVLLFFVFATMPQVQKAVWQLAVC